MPIMPQPEIGRFEPDKFLAADDAPKEIEWKPGTWVRLAYSSGRLFDMIPPIFVTGLVCGFAAYVAAAWLQLEWRWPWALLAFPAGIGVRTLMERRRVAAHVVLFDWNARAVTFSKAGTKETVPFGDLLEIVLRGKSATRANVGNPGRSTVYWCELSATTPGAEHAIAATRTLGSSEGAYQMLAPMAAALGGSLDVPWRWEEFVGTNSFLDSVKL
ncbi:MAG: hypothetical protein ACHQNV_06585 [Vicinamibacteria bacterium]